MAPVNQEDDRWENGQRFNLVISRRGMSPQSSPAPPPALIVMDWSSVNHGPSRKELMERIDKSLRALLCTLATVNLDITLYRLTWHTVENIRRHPSEWNQLDETYTAYEEQANNCRRIWMKLRAVSEQETSQMTVGSNSSALGFRPAERSPSPLEYLSEAYEDELPAIKMDDQDVPVDLYLTERDIPRPPKPATDPPPPRQKQKKDDPTTSRTAIATPSGSTSCRLAPIPKGMKLSVETTRIPTPQNPFTFNIPRKLIVKDPGRKPLNRSKRNHPETYSSLNSPSSSLPSSSRWAGASTAQTSVSASPRRNYSSATEYRELRRAIRPTDFQMNEDRRLNSLDCLGPPFDVKKEEITHNTFPATYPNLRMIYGVGTGLTPKVSPDRLSQHGFQDWMVPNMDCHPFLPARPGWPGLMLQLNDDLEEWEPEGGREFRVIIKKEPGFVEYVGQYEMLRLSDITGDEWRQQPAKVRNAWTRVIGGGISWKDAVARVALRKKLGKEPSMAEFSKYTNGFTNENYKNLAEELKEEVGEAFRMGQEIVAVWGMKCVGYDYKFEKHLARSLRGIKPVSPGLPRKRKAPARDSDAMSEDEDGKGESDSESEDISPSKRRRAAKGKAKYDWSGARYPGDSQDEDYRPASS